MNALAGMPRDKIPMATNLAGRAYLVVLSEEEQ